jgi:hypothetical protein
MEEEACSKLEQWERTGLISREEYERRKEFLLSSPEKPILDRAISAVDAILDHLNQCWVYFSESKSSLREVSIILIHHRNP